MVKTPHAAPRAIRAVLGLLALLLTAGALAFTAIPASAAPLADPTGSPSPTPSATAPAQFAEIWVRVASDKSNVPNVTVKVTGPKGFSKSFVTGPDGKVQVDAAVRGDYVFTLDAGTLPDKTLGPAINPLKITIAQGDQGDPAYFLLTPGGASTNPGSSASPSPGSGGSGGGHSTDYFSLVSNLTVNGIIFGLLIALASIGVSLIYGTTGLSNFAHGEMVTFGALSGYVFSGILHFPIAVALALGIRAGRGVRLRARPRALEAAAQARRRTDPAHDRQHRRLTRAALLLPVPVRARPVGAAGSAGKHDRVRPGQAAPDRHHHA